MPKKRTTPPKVKAPTKKIRKSCLDKDAQLESIRQGAETIPDSRRDGGTIPLADIIMSGYAMFDLKFPSMLPFDDRRKLDTDNLMRIYGIGHVACDTQIRTVLDTIDPALLRQTFRGITAQLQRGNALQQLVYYQGYYLLSLDGTGYYSSKKVSSGACQVKKHRNGTETHYQQVLGAALVHPDHREVIPLPPEMLVPQDGTGKNDCERNGAKRFLPKFRAEYPKLRVIVVEDGISSNAPHVTDLIDNDMRFILGAKEGDHPLLFKNLYEATLQGTATNIHPDRPQESGHYPHLLLSERHTAKPVQPGPESQFHVLRGVQYQDQEATTLLLGDRLSNYPG